METRKRGLQADLHRLTGKARPSISNWFNNPEKVSSIERADAEVICGHYFPDVSPTWLAEGTGPKYLKEGKQTAVPIKNPPPSPKPHVEPPPPPPPGFEDNRTLSPEEWEVYQAFVMAATPEERRTIIERHESLKIMAEKYYNPRNPQKPGQ